METTTVQRSDSLPPNKSRTSQSFLASDEKSNENPIQVFQQSSVKWEEFETFKKRISEEKIHFRERSSPSKKQDSFQSLDKIISNHTTSTITNPIQNNITLSQQLKSENNELKDKVSKLLEELNEVNRNNQEIQYKYQQQLRQIKEKYELENRELLERFNNFTDEIEGLKNSYKEKNMKLYNLVLQLEKEKQQYLESNISQLEPKNQKDKGLAQLNKDQQILIVQLEQKNIKILQEKLLLEQQYNDLQKQFYEIKYGNQSIINDVKFHFKQGMSNSKPPTDKNIERSLEANSSIISLIQDSERKSKSKSSKQKEILNKSSISIQNKENIKPKQQKPSSKKVTPRQSINYLNQTDYEEQSQERLKSIIIQTPKQKSVKQRQSSLKRNNDSTKKSTQSVKVYSTFGSANKQQQGENKDENQKPINKKKKSDKSKAPLNQSIKK